VLFDEQARILHCPDESWYKPHSRFKVGGNFDEPTQIPRDRDRDKERDSILLCVIMLVVAGLKL
jgi:hypothetical protein